MRKVRAEEEEGERKREKENTYDKSFSSAPFQTFLNVPDVFSVIQCNEDWLQRSRVNRITMRGTRIRRRNDIFGDLENKYVEVV